MGRGIFLAVSMAALWLLLSGYFDKPLLLFFGACTVALSVWLSVRAGVLDREGAPLDLMPGVFLYWFWLAKEIGKSNIAVARQALAIEPTLSPKIFRVPTQARSAAGIATFANSVTLTPGTVTVDLELENTDTSEAEQERDDKRGFLLIHALTDDFADVAGINEMGARVVRFEKSGPQIGGGAA